MKKLLVAIVICMSFMTANANAYPLPWFGFNDDPINWENHGDAATSIGANIARFSFGWFGDPDYYEPFIRDIEAQGLRPMIVLWGQEYPDDLDDFAKACADWAKKYPDAVFQIWNEPNHRLFGSIANPKKAARLVSAGALAIREASPNTTVVGPGIPPGVKEGKPSEHWRWYFNGLYEELPKKVQVGLHIFPYSKHPMRTLGQFYRRAEKWGQVWVTEIGFFGNVYGSAQPKVSAKGYRKLVRKHAKAVIFHRLAPSTMPSEWEIAASMSITDDPLLASHLAKARLNSLTKPQYQSGGE